MESELAKTLRSMSDDHRMVPDFSEQLLDIADTIERLQKDLGLARKQRLSRRDLLPVYPVAVIMDRYGGAYSGGMWLAIKCADAPCNCRPNPLSTRVEYALVEGPSGSDSDAMSFWIEPWPDWIAAGDTSEGAIKNLLGGVSAPTLSDRIKDMLP